MTEPPEETLDIGEELDKLALELLKGAMGDPPEGQSVTFETRVDVFKAVSAHHINMSKVKGKMLPLAPKGTTMASLRGRVAEASGIQSDEEEDQTDG